MRVYVIGRDYQAADIDIAQAASKFLAWLTADPDGVLTQLICVWLWLPADSGGQGALADSSKEIAQLRAQVITAWQSPDAGSSAPGPQEQT